MVKIATTEEYTQRLLDTYRPGLEDVLAFYEHRMGVIGKDPRLMLIPLDDHMVHRGDGVFETLKFVHRRIYQLDAHLQRMKKSGETIFLQPPCSWNKVRELVLEVTKAAEIDTGIISMFIGRGPGGFTVDFNESPETSLYIVVRRFPNKPQELWEKGVTAIKTSVPAKQSYMAKIKSVNYLPNVLMKREAIIKNCHYPICFDENGYLAEGATENVCLVDQLGELVVPQLERALYGTTMMRCIDLIKDEMTVLTKPVKEEEIYEAREVLLFGTSFDVLSIVRYNGKPIHDVRPGPVSKRLREILIRDQLENGVLS